MTTLAASAPAPHRRTTDIETEDLIQSLLDCGVAPNQSAFLCKFLRDEAILIADLVQRLKYNPPDSSAGGRPKKTRE
jgi:hypothetical protein